jgi:hypothetical protein
MQIYIHRNNEQLGPFTEAEVRAQLASGAISPQDHVWWQGQANWMQLSQSPLLAPGFTAPPGTAAAPSVNATGQETSKLAIGSLVCGCLCLTLFCSTFACIPAIILGHMALSAIKQNPGLRGRGMALAGTILGYLFVVLVIASWIILLSLGDQVKDIFKKIQAQENAAQATNSADQSATNSDQTTNAPDQTTPAPATTNSPDQSTNSAPAATNSPDQSTNSTPATTNSAASSTNSPTTNAPASSTNAPTTSTNAAPMNP